MMRKVGGVRTLWLRRRRESYDWFSGRGPTMRWTINADQKQWWWPWLTMINDHEHWGYQWWMISRKGADEMDFCPTSMTLKYLQVVSPQTKSQPHKYRNMWIINLSQFRFWMASRKNTTAQSSFPFPSQSSGMIYTYKEMVKTQNENKWSIPFRHFGSKDPKRDIESGIKVA